MKRLLAIAMWGAVVLGIGCSSTIRAKETTTGGEITLNGARRETMNLAEPVMAARCGGPQAYQVVQDSGADAHNTEQGEWRLTYECKSRPQEAKPASPPPAPPPQS